LQVNKYGLMMKRLMILLHLLLMAVMTASGSVNGDVEQACELARRLSPRLADKVDFKVVETDRGRDVFTLESAGGKVVIGGNSAGSMAVGLNRYLNRYCRVTVSWYDDVSLDLPSILPDVTVPERVVARVPQRFFLNYCTWGYTMPFWGWKQWEHFIDWMALNGVNLPLAITGQEAVWYNVWTRLGMTDEQVRNYFTGPAMAPHGQY